MTLLTGTAFITGAGAGIGRATAIAYAKNGITNLALSDINDSAVAETTKLVKEANSSVEVLQQHLDTTDEAAVKKCIEEVVQKFGRLDIACNIAGIGHHLPSHMCETSEWRRVMDINLDGVFFCQREEIRVMMNQEDKGYRHGRGAIINISSVLGLLGIVTPAYCASKHAVLGLTKTDGSMYASMGIRVNAVCPGFIETAMTKDLDRLGEGATEMTILKTPMKRMGQPEEIADCVVFLGSSMASYVTGSGLVADGGYTVN